MASGSVMCKPLAQTFEGLEMKMVQQLCLQLAKFHAVFAFELWVQCCH
jgi:hypothetical protein